MSISESSILQLQTLQMARDTANTYKYEKIYYLIKKRSIVLLLMVMFFSYLMMGCKMGEQSWINQMLSEMEIATTEAYMAKLGQEESDAAVNAVAQKYFQPGMAKENAFKLLHDLKNYGFKIIECRHEGGRVWPDGKFILHDSVPHADKATARNLKKQHPEGMTRFTARIEKYGTSWLIITNGASFGFNITDDADTISDVKGKVWQSSI